MTDHCYILSAVPDVAVEFTNFFEISPSSVVDILRNPPLVRKSVSGWDLRTLDMPRIVKGECWEVSNAERKYIRLYKDGTIIVRLAADDSFLGWGRLSNQPEYSLNALAIIEVTHNFIKLCSSVYRKGNEKIHGSFVISFQVNISGMVPGASRIFRVPFDADSAVWDSFHSGFKAPTDAMERKYKIPSSILVANPEKVSYDLIEGVFTWFGIPANDIPYSIKNEDNINVVDEISIARLK